MATSTKTVVFSCLGPLLLLVLLVRATDARGKVVGIQTVGHASIGTPEYPDEYRDGCEEYCLEEPEKHPGCLNLLVRNGENVSMWLDNWLGPGPLRDLVAGPIVQEDHILKALDSFFEPYSTRPQLVLPQGEEVAD